MGRGHVAQYRAVSGDLKSMFAQDDSDKALQSRLEHLVINVLLFLSTTVPYEPDVKEQPIRQANLRKLESELRRARFVGDVVMQPVGETSAPLPSPSCHWQAASRALGQWSLAPSARMDRPASLRRIQ